MVFDLRRYRGEIVISNPSTGRALTCKVERRPASAHFAPGRVMVSLLVEKDRRRDRAWRPFAFVDLIHGALVWKSKSGRFYGELAMLLNDPRLGQARGYKYRYDK